jgi:hypothetical protein
MLGRVTAGRRSTSLLLALGILASLLITAGIATRVDVLNGIGSLAALAYVLVPSLVIALEVIEDRLRLDASWRPLRLRDPGASRLRPPRVQRTHVLPRSAPATYATCSSAVARVTW